MTDRNTLVAYSHFMHQLSLRIAGEDWVPYVTRNMSFWHQHLSSRGIFLHMRDFGVPFESRQLAFVISGIETHLFQPAGFLKKEGPAVLRATLGTENMTRLEAVYKKEASVLLRLLEECLCNLTVESWRKFFEQYSKFCAALQITAIIGRVGLTELQKRLRELKFTESEIPEYISTITYPDEHTPLFLSQRELHEIAETRQSGLPDEKLHASITEWLSRHRHIPVNFCGEPWSHQDALNQLSAFETGKEMETVRRLTEEHTRKCNKAQTVLSTINDEYVSALAVTVSTGTILNEFRKNVFSRVSLEYRPIFEAVAQKSGGVNWHDCWYLTAEEMGKVIGGETLPLAALKKDREVAAFYIAEQGEAVFLKKRDTRRIYDFVQQFRGKGSERVKSDIHKIRGFPASKGIVKGTVKVVFGAKDFFKVSRGDILVAIMTSVDFIPVMERAAAFVTNEGGITSHASIVAREMGKPCIIGTKIATKVLKDGDMVEVDANEGIVRKIA